MERKRETITGQIIAKANHYKIVPDAHEGKRLILDDAYKHYAQNFYKQCVIYRDRQINRPFRLYADVYQRSMAYDLDNSLKSLLDLLQDVRAITDDNRCVGIVANKHIDRQNPRVTFEIEEIEPTIFSLK